MEPRRNPNRAGGASAGRDNEKTPKWWKLWAFTTILGLDVLTSLVLLAPLPLKQIRQAEDQTSDVGHYTLHGSLWDLALLAIPRVFLALLAISISYHRLQPPPDSPFELYHKNGDKKSKAELEGEELEEPYTQQFTRYVKRLSFLNEVSVLVSGVLLAVKCLSRLNVEIGDLDDSKLAHPLFWIALALTGLLCMIETTFMDSIEQLAGELGRQRRQTLSEQLGGGNWIERISESLAQPLLSRVNSEVDVQNANDVEDRTSEGGENVRGVSDIGPDANYKATTTDLLRMCEPDKYLILLACIFLVAAAVAQVYVPHYSGAVLDAIVGHIDNNATALSEPSEALIIGHLLGSGQKSVSRIPGFIKNIELLLLVSILGGLFSGIRGAIFTMVGARVNVRLRIMLMDSLLAQEIGFYDTTRTGDITSRLSSDTTIVGNSITSNVSIFLRSVVRALGTLVFMFTISWQLSLLAFMTIPAVSILSKWYGRYIRRLSKLQQKKLADGNSVSDSTLSSMATVRSFGAESVELSEFEESMVKYLRLNRKSCIATLGYGTCVGALPQLVNALVLYYGGLMVQSDGSGHLTGGQLVSFILYLSALSEAFNSLGSIYASLARLAGAADKVMELMNRPCRQTVPSHVDEERVAKALRSKPEHLLSVESTRVVEQRAKGRYPESCQGVVTFSEVKFSYPSRPQRQVLNGINLNVPAGSIVAITGSSGGGKSSITRLIQNLYEPSSGSVCIDGIPVQELSSDWLCRHVSAVGQEPTLFARSIKRNIIYGLEGTEDEPSQEEIEHAARLANASAFIEGFPEGYETEVGERGITLSGGQKQRIAIARALVRKPRVLILDEATSALDAESEHFVQEAIDSMISGQRSLDGDPSRTMTLIIVAHRLSTIRNSDLVYVVKDGTVVEEGTHDRLTAIDGVYSSLVKRQLGNT